MTDAHPHDYEVAGTVGEPIVLPIGNAGATGYSWTLDLPDGVEPLGETTPEPPQPGGELGATTGARLVVVAHRAGTHVVAGRLARPWEDEPSRTVRIRMQVS